MSTLTMTDLTELLRACAGDAEHADLDGDVLDETFADLGYDSLALLELSGQIKQRYGVALPDDAARVTATPRQFLALVNSLS